MALAAALRRGPEGKTLPWRLGVLQGFVCYFLGQGMQYVAQSLLTPTLASLMLNAGMVLFIVAADRIRLHEAPGRSLYAKSPCWWPAWRLITRLSAGNPPSASRSSA